MMPGEPRDAATLLDLIQACSRIIAFTSGVDKSKFEGDQQLTSAVSFQISILGEAVKRLSVEFQGRHPEIAWRKIAGMRDRLIHGYDDIDIEELWNTALRDVPQLLVQLRRIQIVR
jgi:uncharacterized protein with HEPN domain